MGGYPQTHKGGSNQRQTGIKLFKVSFFFSLVLFYETGNSTKGSVRQSTTSLSGILHEAPTSSSVIQITAGGPDKFGWIRKKVRN